MIDLSWLLFGLIALTLLLHVVAWLLRVSVAARSFGRTLWLPARWREPLDEGQPVEFAVAGGAKLRGTYLPTTADKRKGVIAYCHELNGDRWNTLPYVEDLRDRGFDIFTFDFRNHGSSQRTPGYEPAPWVTTYETADVRGAIDYLWSRGDADPRGIGLIGVSKGGSAALCAAADDCRVRALVVDGVCSTQRMQVYNPRRRAARYFGWMGGSFRLPAFLPAVLGAWTRLVTGWWRHCRFVNVDRSARRVLQPVLMIHGECDADVPVALARSLHKSMPNGAKLWTVPHAGHNQAIDVARGEYHRRIRRFFNQHLAADSSRGARPGPIPAGYPKSSTGSVGAEVPATFALR